MRSKLYYTLFYMVLFPILGSIMFISDILMEILPNIHLVGMLTVLYTVVYRSKALIPIYIYVFLTGLLYGFALWWVPYLYVWTVLWALTMLVPKKTPPKIAAILYPIVCAVHGISFGILYSPFQALVYSLDFNGTLAWIAAGLPFDITHCISNFISGFLVLPLSVVLKKAEKMVK